MVNIGTSSWTEERLDILKVLWSQGLSASDIAHELGGLTRNAVIGKIHRLGLSGRVKSRPATASQRDKPQRTRLRPMRIASNAGYGDFRAVNGAAAIKPREAEYVEPETADNVMSFPDRKTLLKLESGDCRWPVGDPRSPEFFYCGGAAEEGQSYCAYHCRVAYQPRIDRRKVPLRSGAAR